MNRKKSALLLLHVFLVAAISACNLPSGEPEGTPTPDLALTLTALAEPQDTATPSAPLDTATPEFTPTPGDTATPSVPTVSVSVNTNCRTGPSTQYDLVGGLNVGQTAEVVGKSTSTGYWIIRTPGGGTCWLWGQYATVSGNVAGLPEYQIPPTPTPTKTATPTATPTLAAPAPVTNLVAAKVCAGPPNQYGGTITWQDNSTNEDGFRIYLGGNPHGTVAANVTTYPIPPVITDNPITLSVEAYNAQGASAKVDVIITCP